MPAVTSRPGRPGGFNRSAQHLVSEVRCVILGRPAIRVEVQRQYWSLIRAGEVPGGAADAVGVSRTVAWRWFRNAGGVMPPVEPAPDAGSSLPFRLTFAEREEIACRRAAGHGVRVIARALGRPPSTISRELSRGTVRRKSGYRATVAQAAADARARRPKVALLADNGRLREHVQKRLLLKDSPEQISRRLLLDFPAEVEMRVSHETIYQSLYVQGRGALRRDLAACLRTGRALRKPHRKAAERRGRIADMVNISKRPAEVADRAVPGHWEGDLITGSVNKSAIGTLVERTTGYVCLRHAPWQRGGNENANGLLRQYFRLVTDRSGYHRDYLEFVAAQLNRRPRKRLAWRTPAEALDQLLFDPHEQPGVALTG